MKKNKNKINSMKEFKKVYTKVVILLSAIRLIPHILLFNFHPLKNMIKYDVIRWLKCFKKVEHNQYGFIYLMTFYPEFRNLFYHRIGFLHRPIKWLCPQMNTLFLCTAEIGPGLIIQHGFATIVSAKSIGKDCWINQQVTIGYTNDTDAPTLGDNVTIRAGAKILGGIHIGNNSIVGANAVVIKNVPENCTVVGVPAYICRRNGIKVNEKL